MISLPLKGAWQVSQTSDLSGSVIGTKNLDFNKNGYLQLARKSSAITSSSSASFFGNPIVMATDGTYHYLVQDQGFTVYNFANNISYAINFQSGGGIPFFGVYSDAVFFNSLIHVSSQTTVARYSGGTGGAFTTEITGLNVNLPHPLCVMENSQTLLVGDGNRVHQYSTSYSHTQPSGGLLSDLVIPSDYIVTWIRYRQSTAVIGTRNILGGEAKIFMWNGSGDGSGGDTGAQSAYGIGCDWAYSGIEYVSSIAVIASSGRLLRFNGSGFDELAHLPVYDTSYSWTSTPALNVTLVGKVASRGMGVHGDIIYINLDGSLNINANEYPGSYLENQPGGLWVYDPDVGFYHKAGYAADGALQLIPTSLASSNLVFAVPTQVNTGDPVYLETAGGITGLNAGQTYFAIQNGTYAFSVALTPEDALAGRYIVLSGSITIDTFVLNNHTQEGASQIVSPGFVLPIQRPHINNFIGTEVIYGGQVADGSMATQNVIMSLGNNRTRGYMVTPKMQSSQIKDSIQNLYAKFDPLLFSGDSFVLKYRTDRRTGLPTIPASITWASTTTFSVNSVLYDVKNIQIGDEVEILSGAAAGYSGHVTAINNASSSYVFTLEHSFPVTVGQTSIAVSSDWKKFGTITSTNNMQAQAFSGSGIDTSSTWYQFKVELIGNQLSMNGLQIVNSVSKPAN